MNLKALVISIAIGTRVFSTSIGAGAQTMKRSGV